MTRHRFPSLPPTPAPAWQRRSAAVLAACAFSAAGPATAAADRADLRIAQAAYAQERAACLNGSSPQDRVTCLKEAGAALAEARRGSSDAGETAADRRRNALVRCGRVLPADRADCERRVRGEGQRSGSVAGGGVLMQTTTRSAEAAAVPASAASGGSSR